MFRFWSAAPRLLVPDNLKSGIHKASFYDPEVNRSYAMMAAHYNVGILPARSRRTKDKAIVERPAMQELPPEDHEYAEWHLARVGIDDHVEVLDFSTQCRTR